MKHVPWETKNYFQRLFKCYSKRPNGDIGKQFLAMNVKLFTSLWNFCYSLYLSHIYFLILFHIKKKKLFQRGKVSLQIKIFHVFLSRSLSVTVLGMRCRYLLVCVFACIFPVIESKTGLKRCLKIIQAYSFVLSLHFAHLYILSCET